VAVAFVLVGLGGGYGKGKTVYNPADRLWATNLESLKSIQTPTLQCANKNRDLFTVSTASIGNKKLTYPVGLITSDEIVFAGGLGGANNTSYYLYTNQKYWTMSPHSLYYQNALVFVIYSNGQISNCNNINELLGMRPVINLHSDIELTGTGTMTDPYVVN